MARGLAAIEPFVQAECSRPLRCDIEEYEAISEIVKAYYDCRTRCDENSECYALMTLSRKSRSMLTQARGGSQHATEEKPEAACINPQKAEDFLDWTEISLPHQFQSELNLP